jgi:hypothetical protein
MTTHAAAPALQKADTFEPQGLANAAWAFAKLGYHDSSLYEALADAVSFRVEELNAQGLCNVAWALATAGYYQPQLATKLAQQVGRCAWQSPACLVLCLPACLPACLLLTWLVYLRV